MVHENRDKNINLTSILLSHNDLNKLLSEYFFIGGFNMLANNLSSIIDICCCYIHNLSMNNGMF